ncbi:MAG: CapA family protein, partial [Cyanobacteria bacterium P01_F01_bin.53]
MASASQDSNSDLNAISDSSSPINSPLESALDVVNSPAANLPDANSPELEQPAAPLATSQAAVIAEAQAPATLPLTHALESGVAHFLRQMAQTQAEAAIEEAAIEKDVSIQETAIEETAIEETAIEETAIEETAIEETVGDQEAGTVINPAATKPEVSQPEEANQPEISQPSPEANSEANLFQTSLAGLDVRPLAAAGYFQAIAYWLNERLIPQQVYAQVLEDEVPGRLRILVEFERPPQPKRLIRFVCDRLYKLNSDVIEGVHLIARALGSAKTDWEHSIRIPTASQRQPKQSTPTAAATATSPDTLQTSALEKATQPELTQPIANPKRQLVHESPQTQIARQVVRSQFKFFRAALVSGTAAAAFLFGGFTELILSDKLAAPRTTSETIIPWYGEETDGAGDTAIDFTNITDQLVFEQTATNVSFRPASRFQSRTVEAALETVAVSPHDDVVNPSDPTVTLLFGGELSLNDFTFEAADDLDHLFSDIDIYKKADVAMLGLAEPLANASTTLQEDFYQRTRPQAVAALKLGGIDIVGLASEGSLTYGARGLGETLTNLDRQGIYRVGAGRDQAEAHRPEILEVKGQRIAYLGYNSEAIKGAQAKRAGVALTTSEERQHIIEDIKAIRSQVDWIVVNYRWGNTLTTPEEPKSSETAQKKLLTVSIPEEWQKSLAREAVDAGADLVVGYHPNQIQGAEIYHDRAIAYSLGDFVFEQAPLEDHDTAALRVSLRNKQMKVEFLPVTIRESKLQMATGEHGAAILQTIRNASRTFDKPMRFPKVLNAKPNRFLPESQHKTSSTPDPEPTVESTPAPTSEPLRPAPESNQRNEDISRPEDINRPSDPRMQESEALFIPAEDIHEDIHEDAKNSGRTSDEAADEATEPWQAPWQDETLLDTWGEKNTDTDRDFSPIPEGPIERQIRGDAPEELPEDLPEAGPEDRPLENEQDGRLERSQAETFEESLQYAPATESELDLDEKLNGGEAAPNVQTRTDADLSDDFRTPIHSTETIEIDTNNLDTAASDTTRDISLYESEPSAADFFEAAPLEPAPSAAEPTPTALEVMDSPEPGTIAPYEEPLVGPLSA